MKIGKGDIFEAKSNYQKYLEAQAAKHKDLPSSLRGEKKTPKEKDPDQPSQKDWYELKKARFEHQKQQELANKKASRQAEISGALKGIQTQQISKDDKEGTAYKKLIGNIGSAAAGVGKAVIAAAKPQPKSAQPELKEPGKPGRPKVVEIPKPTSKPNVPTSGKGGPLATTPKPGALTTIPKPGTPDKRRLLPPSTQGGTRVGQPAKMIGQPSPQRPALPMALDKRRMLPPSSQGTQKVGQPASGTRPQIPGSQKKAAIKAGTYKPIKSIGEKYSNWKEELIVEKNLIIEVGEKITADKSSDKTKKKRIVDIMQGENNIEINPKIGNYFGYNESYDDETFRQHSRETFSSHTPSEKRKRTAGVLKLMKQMNTDTETPKKKKKKKAVSEECGCQDDKKKVLAMALVKKLVDAKKKKNFQLNNEIIGEACWKKYKQVGMKKKGKKIVPNCVPKEDYMPEARTIRSFKPHHYSYSEKGTPITPEGAIEYGKEVVKRATQERQRRNLRTKGKVPTKQGKPMFEDKLSEASPAWQKKEGKNPEGGLNKKGIASYRREHPGSKLSLAVTTPPSKLDPDSKSAKRRKSFCARMGGMPGPMKDEKGRPTRKALSLRKWNC